MFNWITKKINEFEEEGSLSVVWKVLFLSVVLFLITMASCQIASSQTYFRGDIQGKLEIWPQSERCYQHSMESTGKLESRLEFVKLSWEETFRWWGNCDSKIADSFTNAESGMAIGRRRDIKLLFGGYKNLWIGSRVYRNGIHHIWRNKNRKADRYDGWVKNGWKQGVKDCENNNPVKGELSCGSIGYWDRIGPTVVYNPEWGHFEATWLAYQWKDLTLPPNDAMFEGQVTFFNWTIGTKVEHSVVGNFYYTGRIIYNLSLRVPNMTASENNDKLFKVDALSIGLRGGKLRTPGWKVNDPIEFAAVVLKIQ